LERTITLQTDTEDSALITVVIRAHASGLFDAIVTSPNGSVKEFTSVHAQLTSPTELSTSLVDRARRTTIVSQQPPAHIPASASPATMERLHIFADGSRTTLVLPSPAWLRSLGGDILGATSGALRAPMPSLVVELKVSVGDRVAEGDAVIVLESMKTETVLRATRAGVVRAVSCSKGEMVEEGKELVDIEDA
jgi:3-methylcrotonyl-CoA carboxylase alpha subunit